MRASLPAPLPSTHHKHSGRIPLQRADSPGRRAAFHGKPMHPGSDVPLPAFHPRWAFRARVHPTCTEEKGDCQHRGPGCTGTCSRLCAWGRVLFLQGHQCRGGGGRPILEELKPLLVPNTKLAFKAEVLQSCGFRKSSRKVPLVQYSGVTHSSTFLGP